MAPFGVQSGEMIWQQQISGIPASARVLQAKGAERCSEVGTQTNAMLWLLP